jgi:ATP-dependent Clp protease protease subunit
VRKIELYGAIGFDVTAAQVVAQLDAAGNEPVRIHINSEGGIVSEANAIYSRIVQREGRTECMVDGIAASAASLIVQACDFRMMPGNAQLMLHAAWTKTAGNADELRQSADYLEKTSNQMAQIYAERSGLSLDEVRGLLARDTWLSADECLALGLCDAVTSPTRATVAAVALAKQRFMALASVDGGDLPLPVTEEEMEDEEKAEAMEDEETPEAAEEMPDAAEESEADEETPEMRIAAMEEELAKLRALLEANRAEVDAQSARADAAEASLVARELADAGVPAEHRDALAKLRSVDAELYATTLSLHARPGDAAQPRIGVPGDVAVMSRQTPAQILAEARTIGVEYGGNAGNLTAWLRANYPDQRAEVTALARQQYLAQTR